MNEQGALKELEAKVLERALRESAERAVSLSFVFAVLFCVYGFTSLGFIGKFRPELTVFDNLWPRVLLGTVPMAFIGLALRASRCSNQKKILLWITSFAMILHVTAWIHVWPIALTQAAEMLPYVHAANVYIFSVIYSVVAPPGPVVLRFSAIFFAIFVAPLFAVAWFAGDPVIFRHVMSDSITALAVAIFLGRVADRIRCRLFLLEARHEGDASRFLGPVLSKAIFKDQSERLERVRCRGFVASIDIRDSTLLQQELGEAWMRFREDYFSLVSRCVADCGGYIQKTVGDCHVINFGIMDYGVDLSDVPGIETELAQSDEKRLERASGQAFDCMERLFSGFGPLVERHFGVLDIRLGAGLDKGWVERGVQGHKNHALELDVNGDPVNCSNRLQEYSKALYLKNNWEGSLLVVSPFASDYLKDLSGFVRVNTHGNPIRNFATIRWVLARRFDHQTQAVQSVAA